VASQIGDAAGPLLDAANEAFINGMQSAVWVAVGVALVGAVVTWLFLPARPSPPIDASGSVRGGTVAAP
jgi:hypothetical protein